jgi:predicted dehydrogenase
VKTAVLGVGRMGRRHIGAVRRLGLELVAVFDTSRESREAARAEYGLAESVVFDDLDRLFALSKPECVIVATTADSHCELVCTAAERHAKFVLVEKPMAVSLRECDVMIESCMRRGAALAVNHQMRFMEQYTEPKKLFDSPEYGGMASMTVVAGNFGFAMNGVHYFEAFRFLAGEDPVEVTGWFSPGIVPNPRGSRFEDRAGSIRAVTASGKRLYMEIGADQGHGVRVVYACRNGMVTVDEITGELVSSVREAQYRELPTTRYGMPAINARRVIQPAEVIDTSAAVLKALLTGVDPVTGQDGRRALQLLATAYASAEHGSAPVRLDSHLDLHRVFPWA